MKQKAHYENEVEKPKVPADGHMAKGWGLDDFKSEGMDIAYGQAGKAGCMSDSKKIHAQFKHYSEEANSGY